MVNKIIRIILTLGAVSTALWLFLIIVNPGWTSGTGLAGSIVSEAVVFLVKEGV